METLRHGYLSSTRKALAGPLLDKVHDSLTEDMKKHIDGEKAALVSDGCSNQQKDPIIGRSMVTHSSLTAQTLVL